MEIAGILERTLPSIRICVRKIVRFLPLSCLSRGKSCSDNECSFSVVVVVRSPPRIHSSEGGGEEQIRDLSTPENFSCFPLPPLPQGKRGRGRKEERGFLGQVAFASFFSSVWKEAENGHRCRPKKEDEIGERPHRMGDSFFRGRRWPLAKNKIIKRPKKERRRRKIVLGSLALS